MRPSCSGKTINFVSKIFLKMNYIKLICAALVISVAIPASAKKTKNKSQYGVYMVGVSASFTDSLVYFTDIQQVDSAFLGDKGLLQDRMQYSLQLKDYLESNEGGKNRTCFVYYNKKRKKLQKELTKIKQKYQKGKTQVLRDVNPSFKFQKAETYE